MMNKATAEGHRARLRKRFLSGDDLLRSSVFRLNLHADLYAANRNTYLNVTATLSFLPFGRKIGNRKTRREQLAFPDAEHFME